MSIQTVHLSRLKYSIPPIVHMVQADTGRNLKIIIDDETISSGSVGILCFERPDGTEYDESTAFSPSDNSFTANCTQGLTVDGKVRAMLKCTDSSGGVSTYAFYIDVQRSPSAEIEEQEVSTVQTAILLAEAAKAEAEAAAETADAAAETAGNAANNANNAAETANTAADAANAAAKAATVVTGPFFILDERTAKTYNCSIAIQTSGKPVMLYDEVS